MSETNSETWPQISVGPQSVFAEVMQQSRERLTKEREHLFEEQRKLEDQLAANNREVAAIEAYEAVKLGTAVAAGRKAAIRSNGAARRGSKRDTLVALVREHGPLSRGEMIEHLGAKGDRSGEMSISNALTNLTKTNQLVRENGKYQLTS